MLQIMLYLVILNHRSLKKFGPRPHTDLPKPHLGGHKTTAFFQKT